MQLGSVYSTWHNSFPCRAQLIGRCLSLTSRDLQYVAGHMRGIVASAIEGITFGSVPILSIFLPANPIIRGLREWLGWGGAKIQQQRRQDRGTRVPLSWDLLTRP
ncbi:MAG: hypothetical protein ACI97A_001553 [Planctomycetota bacterium]|jgi:hypothetical protein